FGDDGSAAPVAGGPAGEGVPGASRPGDEPPAFEEEESRSGSPEVLRPSDRRATTDKPARTVRARTTATTLIFEREDAAAIESCSWQRWALRRTSASGGVKVWVPKSTSVRATAMASWSETPGSGVVPISAGSGGVDSSAGPGLPVVVAASGSRGRA